MDLQAVGTMHMHQNVTMMVNRYEIFADDGSGAPGELLAYVEQKRATFKEQVTIYADASKAAVLARFRAAKVIDLGSGYAVTTPDGADIGSFRKDFKQSLLNSTWHLEQAGHPRVTGRERSKPIAIIRRLWEFVPFIENIPFPFRYHFDFAADGSPMFSVDKKTWIRDHYLISIADPSLDRRLVMAQAVAVDALQSR